MTEICPHGDPVEICIDCTIAPPKKQRKIRRRGTRYVNWDVAGDAPDVLGSSTHRCTLFEHRHEKGNTYPALDDDTFELVEVCDDPTHPPRPAANRAGPDDTEEIDASS